MPLAAVWKAINLLQTSLTLRVCPIGMIWTAELGLSYIMASHAGRTEHQSRFESSSEYRIDMAVEHEENLDACILVSVAFA